MASLAVEAQVALDKGLRGGVAPYSAPAGLELPGVSLLATGRSAARSAR